jgi:Fe-S cluster biogenesis protein NfuA
MEQTVPPPPGKLNRDAGFADPEGMDWNGSRPRWSDVEAALDRLRPALVADGGNVELVGVDDDGTVRVTLQGACANCPAQLATVRVGLEEPLVKGVAGVTAVVPV